MMRCACVSGLTYVQPLLFCCFYVSMFVFGHFLWRKRERERVYHWICLSFSSLCATQHMQGYTHTHTHTLSCKTTWLPTASPPASSAARDLARLIIFLLIECRGTLQGWVIKLMQRMFVSTVYLSTAKRYIRHTAHRHKHTHTLTHICKDTDVHMWANKYKWCSCTQTLTFSSSLKHVQKHALRIHFAVYGIIHYSSR